MSPQRRGFTLMEVLVAMAVLAIALPALIKAVGSNIASVSHLKEKTIAQWVALNRITELQAARAWPEVGLSDGSETMANVEWFYQVKVDGTPEKDMKKVQVEVRLHREDKRPVVTLDGYIGKP